MIEWDLGLAVLSEYVEGFLQVAVDLYGPGASGRSLEVVHPLGFLSRPRDTDVDDSGGLGRGAGTLYGFDGSRGWAFPTTDPRFVELVPELKKGGTVMYAPGGGSFLLLDGDNGSAQLYVPYGNTAASISIDVSTEGEEAFQVLLGGMTIVMKAEDHSILLMSANGSSWIKIDDDGITLAGNVSIPGGCVVGNPVTAQPVLTGAAGAELPSAIFKASIAP